MIEMKIEKRIGEKLVTRLMDKHLRKEPKLDYETWCGKAMADLQLMTDDEFKELIK